MGFFFFFTMLAIILLLLKEKDVIGNGKIFTDVITYLSIWVCYNVHRNFNFFFNYAFLFLKLLHFNIYLFLG